MSSHGLLEPDLPLSQQKDGMVAGFLVGMVFLALFVSIYIPASTMNAIPTPNTTMDSDIASFISQIDSNRVNTYLKGLQRVAAAHGGNRSVGTSGYDASVEYVVNQLRDNNICKPHLQIFNISEFVSYATPNLTEVSPSSVPYPPTDFELMPYSGSGNVTAVVAPPPGSSFGCEEADWSPRPMGDFIAVIQRGNCTFRTKALNAIAGGAKGVIIYNTGINADTMGPFRGTLADLVDVPVFSVNYNFGIELLAANPRPTLHMFAHTGIRDTETTNVLCETYAGDPTNTIVVGSHLDSVPDGPGINDNGSGTALTLELVIQLGLSKLELTNRVIFAWWGAEEIGLKGSAYYVKDLSKRGEISNIALNLNFDMVGSPNAFLGVYEGSAAEEPIRKGCSAIEDLFIYYFDYHNIPWKSTPFTGRSDYGPFIAVQIPAGGLFTGAEVTKSAEERTSFGGLANAAYDPCYHKGCDSLENIALDFLQDNTEAAAFALGTLVTQTSLREYLGGASPNTVRLARTDAPWQAAAAKFPDLKYL